MTLEAGDFAPSFEAMDQFDEMHDLEDYEGKWIVLYFYPEDDTSGCIKEACSFRDNIGKVQDKAVLLGVSGDTIESHKKFSEKHNLNFPIMADPHHEIIDAYGADGLAYPKRSTFLISPEGMIEKIYSGVDPETHVEDVIVDLAILADSFVSL